MAFCDGAKGNGVQPIVGTMLAVARPGIDRLIVDWLALYAQDAKGYDNLCALVSAAHLDRPVHEDAHVPLSKFEGLTDGLIALTAGGEGALTRLLAEEQVDAANAYADALEKLFPGRLYIELVRRDQEAEEKAEGPLIDMAYARDIPLVATNPTSFADPDFFAAHDAMLCIASSSYVESADRNKSSPHLWMKDAAEMSRLFEDVPEALANTLVVAQRCAFAAPYRKPILPSLAGDRDAEA